MITNFASNSEVTLSTAVKDKECRAQKGRNVSACLGQVSPVQDRSDSLLSSCPHNRHEFLYSRNADNLCFNPIRYYSSIASERLSALCLIRKLTIRTVLSRWAKCFPLSFRVVPMARSAKGGRWNKRRSHKPSFLVSCIKARQQVTYSLLSAISNNKWD